FAWPGCCGRLLPFGGPPLHSTQLRFGRAAVRRCGGFRLGTTPVPTRAGSLLGRWVVPCPCSPSCSPKPWFPLPICACTVRTPPSRSALAPPGPAPAGARRLGPPPLRRRRPPRPTPHPPPGELCCPGSRRPRRQHPATDRRRLGRYQGGLYLVRQRARHLS